MDADGVGLVDLVSADSLEQFGQCHPGFHPGQVGTETEVGTAAETLEFGADLAADDEVVGVLERPLVAVCRARKQQQHIAVGNRGVVERQLAGDSAGQDLARGVVAQRLLDPQRHALQVRVDRSQLIGVLVPPERRIGKQFGGCLVAGDHHQEHEARGSRHR